MTRHLLGIAAIATAAGCGDDARQCGDGTTDIDGVCVPATMTVCGDGTKLQNAQCVVDPETCEDGTVLIANRCVDPTRGLVVDLEESTEPNALGIVPGIEASTAPAGTITLKSPGAPFVVHGRIVPFRDVDRDGQLDADFDTYHLSVSAPTLLAVTVDGVGGTQGALYVRGDPQGAVPGYERYGLNLTGDTSRRRMFLPVAGRFALVIADTRTLAIGNNPPRPAGAGAGAGGPLAEYYATITVVTTPTPTAIPVTGGVGSHAGALATDEVELFSAEMGAGNNEVRNLMPGAAAASIAVVHAGQLKGYADETSQALAELAVGGFTPGDAPLIVVDAAYNYGPTPEPFTLTITQR